MRRPLVETLSDREILALLGADRGRTDTAARDGPAHRSPLDPAPARRRAAVREALRRMAAGRGRARRPTFRCSAEVFAQVGAALARRRQERFLVVALDARNRLLSRHVVALGTLASCVVHPREVFAPLVRRRAAAAILVHNHPSGDPTPSPEDEELTGRLVQAGRLLGIPVLDHLVVGRDGYHSFRDAGKIG